ncbi:MAG: prepilin-type N-terminal cleavage/methylation domain-containing protein [Kiritimatiellae bacterium]|nr:prepilin-type N-terminal cleavage/methylation domain-containing protein [Kiritimatiellia bacterium]
MSASRGFTLIEMLIVVGIIILLMALSFPAIGRAMRSAKRGKCGAQLQEFGKMCTMYTRHNAANERELYPSSDWRWELIRFLRDTNSIVTISACPGADRRPSSDSSYSGHPAIFSGNFKSTRLWSPSSTILMVDGTISGSGDASRLATSLTSYVNSTSTNKVSTNVFSDRDGTADGRLSLRHAGPGRPTCNVLFADAHVQSCMSGDLLESNISTNRYSILR